MFKPEGIFKHIITRFFSLKSFSQFLIAMFMETYMNYLSKFKWYQARPDLKTSRDAANERDFWEYVKLDPRNLEFAMQITFYIANVLEDGYIEGRILADFPGVLGYILSVMRDHLYQDMRTVTQMMELEGAGSGHIFHTRALCRQKVHSWREETKGRLPEYESADLDKPFFLWCIKSLYELVRSPV